MLFRKHYLFPGVVTIAVVMLLEVAVSAAERTPAWSESVREAEGCLQVEDYACARTAYRRAQRQGAKPWVMFNAAHCSEKLGELKAAITLYKKYLALETEKALYDKLVETAAQKVGALEKRIAKLWVENTPEGAMLSIDGYPMDHFTGEMPLRLDPGHYVVNITAPGYQALVDEIALKAGEKHVLNGYLPPIQATLTVDCEGVNRLVYMDDTLVGSCPARHAVDPGPLVVVVSERGMKSYRGELILEKGEKRELTVNLEPLAWWKAGAVTAAVGAIGLGLGGFFNYKHNQRAAAYESGNSKLKRIEDDMEALDFESASYDKDYDELSDEWDKEKARVDTNYNKATKARNGLISGYVLGGVLLGTGIGLVLYYWQTKKRGNVNDVSIRSSSLVVRF